MLPTKISSMIFGNGSKSKTNKKTIIFSMTDFSFMKPLLNLSNPKTIIDLEFIRFYSFNFFAIA